MTRKTIRLPVKAFQLHRNAPLQHLRRWEAGAIFGKHVIDSGMIFPSTLNRHSSSSAGIGNALLRMGSKRTSQLAMPMPIMIDDA